MARVNNKFRVTSLPPPSSDGSQRVLLTPIYTGDPNYTTGIALADNSERSIEILIPKTSTSNTFFKLGSDYYMDFTLVT